MTTAKETTLTKFEVRKNITIQGQNFHQGDVIELNEEDTKRYSGLIERLLLTPLCEIKVCEPEEPKCPTQTQIEKALEESQDFEHQYNDPENPESNGDLISAGEPEQTPSRGQRGQRGNRGRNTKQIEISLQDQSLIDNADKI